MSWIATPESTSIAGYEYFKESQTLVLEFKKGGRYKYFDVPEAVYEQLELASSKGTFHAERIKNRFRYAKT